MNRLQTISSAVALCLASAGAYAVAQPKPGHGHGKTCDHECPMHAAAELSDIKVELTKQGAVIQLVAKRAEDVSALQQHAQKLAEMLKSGACAMHADHGGMHQHSHAQPTPNAK